MLSTVAPAIAATVSRRNAAIDHLRIVLTALVIFHHTAIVYGGSGGWYWREQPNASNSLLLMFNAINQSYFMGFFFLLAGYYTPLSVERKGAGRYVAERLLRLGVPLVVYFFFLSTFTIALARTHDGHPLWSGWIEMMRAHTFGPGPLWFAETLLLFAAAYLVWRRIRPQATAASADDPVTLPRFRTLAFAAVALGLANFLVRLAIPVGREVLWLQLGYFPCYVYLFAAGCAASRSRLLESITFSQARPWLIVSAVALVTMPVMINLHLDGNFAGGWNANAVFYAFWDPFVAWGVILGALWAARVTWARPTPLTTTLAGSAFAAYIVHPPVVVGFSLLASTWTQPPLAKFAVVGTLATAASFLLGALLRRLPLASRVL